MGKNPSFVQKLIEPDQIITASIVSAAPTSRTMYAPFLLPPPLLVVGTATWLSLASAMFGLLQERGL